MSKENNFETAIKELDAIVKALETGETSLDESMQMFEKGIELVRLCNQKLENAEQKIKILTEKNGQITPEDFKAEQE